MKKNYNIVLTKEEFEIYRKYLKANKIVYEASSYYCGDIYVSLMLDSEELEKCNKFVSENIA